MTDIKKFFKNDRYATISDLELMEVNNGYAVARVMVGDKHLNALNIVQGGLIFTLADFVMGAASNSCGQAAVTINANISFIAKSLPGDTLIGTAREISRSRKLAVYEVDIKNQNNQTVALVNGMVYYTGKELC